MEDGCTLRKGEGAEELGAASEGEEEEEEEEEGRAERREEDDEAEPPSSLLGDLRFRLTSGMLMRGAGTTMEAGKVRATRAAGGVERTADVAEGARSR